VNTNIDRIELKLDKLCLEHVASNYNYSRMPKDQIGASVERLVGTFIRKLQHSDQIKWSVSYPSSWWQHFKRDMMPKWFIKRYPVTLKTESYEYIADLSLVKVADYQMLQACGPNPIYVQLRSRPIRDYAADSDNAL
jgi:hypothetical protein